MSLQGDVLQICPQASLMETVNVSVKIPTSRVLSGQKVIVTLDCYYLYTFLWVGGKSVT